MIRADLPGLGVPACHSGLAWIGSLRLLAVFVEPDSPHRLFLTPATGPTRRILMGFVEVIAKNLLRRKLRTMLTVAGLAAAVATSTALLSSAWSFADSSAAYYSSRGVDVVVVRAGVSERITSSLSASLGRPPARVARGRRG